jgi:hypothetical protein
MKAICLAWKPMRRNTLLGFAKVQLGALIINDVTINTSNGRTWANMPSKPMVDREGAAVKTAEGKTRYIPLLEWASRESSDRFSEAVVAAVEEHTPGALTE